MSLGDDGLLSLETSDVDAFQPRLTALIAAGDYGVRAMESVDASLEAVFDYLVA